MTQTTGRFFDELGKLITDAAGAAQGVRKEIEAVVRAQAENILRELDIVQREEFEAVKAMAQKAREENERLKQRISLLEEAIEDLEAEIEKPPTPRPIRASSRSSAMMRACASRTEASRRRRVSTNERRERKSSTR